MNKKEKLIDREPRQCTYLVVNVCKPGLLKFLSNDAQLVDLSSEGMKLRFSSKIKAKSGDRFIVKIPHPNAPHQFFQFQVEVKWYSSENLAMGVSVFHTDEIEKKLIEHYINVSHKMGRKVV